ncbi:unnamed protein product [Rhizoctonia solani]|uniref:Uncharacterized protein n=1 Tax=Rhizoctonia solani TaxID=456999 RepID=A0A8H3GE50_9AGAM|nr:unnamed protein product [Rhizoctonia solani]
MPGPGLPNPWLLSVIEQLKSATSKLPLKTPESPVDGAIWRNFNINLNDIDGASFEKIDQAYTRCFSRLPGSSADPIDNILRGSYGVVIRFFEDCARSQKLDTGASHLTELKVGQLTDLVYARQVLASY